MNPRAKVYGVATKLSRKMRIALLAAGSVLGTPSVSTSLVNYAGEYLDVVLTAFIVYESVVHSTNIGWYLSWLLVVYLVYSYIPVFYPEWIVTDRGIRALSGVLTAYFGIVFGGLESGLEGITRPLILLLLGLFTGLFLFPVYFRIGRGERVSDPNSELVESLDKLSEEESELKQDIKQLDSFNRPTRALAIALTEFTTPVVLVAPCILMGIGAGFLNDYHPIPATLLFGGIFIGYVTSDTTRSLDTDSYDIEIQTLDTITDAFQNMKGTVLAIICLFGIGMSGIFFSSGVGFIISSVVEFFSILSEGSVSSGIEGIRSGEIGFVEILQAAALLWAVVGMGLSFLLIGVYGLFYWLRQFKRLPRYAEFWENYRHDRTQEQPVAQVARPVGLFVPALLMWSPLMMLLILGNYTSFQLSSFQSVISWLVIGIFDVSWTLFVCVAAWSIWRTRRRDPQPLDGETRDVVIAMGVMIMMSILTGLAVSSIGTLVIVFIVSLTGLMLCYAPEVSIYAEKKGGIIKHLGTVYTAFAFVPVIVALEIALSIPNILRALLVGLFALVIISIYLEQQLDV